MYGAVLRGAVALPGSKATSRTKGSRRNLGDLVWPAVAAAIPGRGRKARSRSCRGTGEGSDEPHSTVEALEQGREKRRRRAWREGGSVGGMADGGQCPGRRTAPGTPSQPPACGSRLPRSNVRDRPVTPDLRQEPGAGKPQAGICAGAGTNPCPYRDRAWKRPPLRVERRGSAARRGVVGSLFFDPPTHPDPLGSLRYEPREAQSPARMPMSAAMLAARRSSTARVSPLRISLTTPTPLRAMLV